MPVANGEPRITTFPWGEAGGVNTIRTVEMLVFDESDEIALPRSRRSQAWMQRAHRSGAGLADNDFEEKGDPNEGFIRMTKLGEH